MPDKQQKQSHNKPDSADTISQEQNISGNVFGHVIQLGKIIITRIDNKAFNKLKQLTFIQLFISISVIILLAGTLYLLVTRLQPLPEKMSGDLKIAVSNFEVIDEAITSDESIRISDAFYTRLNSSFIKLLDDEDLELTITVWDPHEVQRVASNVHGDTQAEKIQMADTIAQKIDADIVIYGEIIQTIDGLSIIPEFYVSPRYTDNFYEAQELIGQYRLGTPLSEPIATIDGEVFGRNLVLLNNEISFRAKLLAQITLGLGMFALSDYQEAHNYFKMGIDEYENSQTSPNQNEGLQVLLVLAGNAASKMNDFEQARNYYERGIEIDPNYSRLYTGLAEVYRQQAVLDNSIDINFVIASIDMYEQSLVQENQPLLIEISAKPRIGLGTSYFLRDYYESPYDESSSCIPLTTFDASINEFEFVINEIGNTSNTNTQLALLASEAYGQLGFVYTISCENSQAASFYEQACNLTPDQIRKKIWCKELDELDKSETTSNP